jgi:pyruvate dehydrogenase E1 component
MVRLLGSGAILREVIAASDMLARDWQISTEVWSATSFSELARDARDVERWNRLHPLEAQRRSHVNDCLEGNAPIVAASDYVRAYPQLIASYVDGRFIALGTDGFGRSDTRATLRRFFEVDRQYIVLAALQALVEEKSLPREVLARALALYTIDSDVSGSWVR